MSLTDHAPGLEAFARDYIQGVLHHSDIRTEHLAEAVRETFGLSTFPTLNELRILCAQLKVELRRMPAFAPFDGANLWVAGSRPEIHVKDGMATVRQETTVCHELREVIEQAFQLVKPDYVALVTHDNARMNPESDHFASCLLMPALASRSLMASLGYDVIRFSRTTKRSLPSVVIRCRSLFSADSGVGPVGGIWLFEPPWAKLHAGAASLLDFRMKYDAKLNGFSMAKGKGDVARLARATFPGRAAGAYEFPLAREAYETGKPQAEVVEGFDLFGQLNYFVAAEADISFGVPRKILMTAIRIDCLGLAKAWVTRIDAIKTTAESMNGVHL